MSQNLRRGRSDSDCSNSDRPHCRQRVEDAPEDPTPITRDPLFYKESGDCILQVENYLFKIHRYHLLRGDASVFSDMFLLPSGDRPSQGSSDTDPIVLSGDTAERVHAFLSIAYAEPLEFQVSETGPERLPTLIHCAHFALKYNITPLLMAALKAITYVIDPKPALDPKLYMLLLELAKLCGAVNVDNTYTTYKYKLEFAVEWAWITQLCVMGEFKELSEVMDVGERYGLRLLLAYSCFYYSEKMDQGPDPKATGIIPPFRDHPWLKPAHRLRILSGAWSLQRAWDNFASTPPAFPPGHVCSRPNHEAACVKHWETIWRQAVSSPEVLGHPIGDTRLVALEDAVELAFVQRCFRAAFGEHKQIDFFRTQPYLHAHFLDPVLDCKLYSFPIDSPPI
ncbi:hypothetical protein C8R43DRAFT_1139659 [Mycena crocata]|nr:hypothetical protein C8R43DRAFT_1139659 [Mycena crocata]